MTPEDKMMKLGKITREAALEMHMEPQDFATVIAMMAGTACVPTDNPHEALKSMHQAINQSFMQALELDREAAK